ncbi:hypothetical protein O181_065848 [Austropuccinia psidii MF-1]|uniref:Uncharacterized protein n=1 Tax=Austropuccinia psidii MF-1 TaxID=1389203 RepID=A0A9Q3I307_9BASI|nr:hypothetical protein [Austropuccinia psidii MF-1]
MVQDLDGGCIIPRLEILKIYIKKYLGAKVFIKQKKFSQEQKASSEKESLEEALKQIKYLAQKIQNSQSKEHKSKETRREVVKELLNQLKRLSEVFESKKKTQSSNNQDHRIENYFLEEENSAIRCNHLTEYFDKIIFLNH